MDIFIESSLIFEILTGLNIPERYSISNTITINPIEFEMYSILFKPTKSNIGKNNALKRNHRINGIKKIYRAIPNNDHLAG